MSKDDKCYAELLKMMQRQGEANNPIGLEMGIMTGNKSCTVGELELDEEDLLISDHLLTGYYKAKDPENPLSFSTISELKSCIEYVEPLKEGDTVIVQQVDDETYAILERMVGS